MVWVRKYFEGDVFENKHGHVYEILLYVRPKRVLIKFKDTGYEYWTSISRIFRGDVRDKSLSRLHGVGINDANYVVEFIANGVRVICPFYRVWKNMIGRCYYKPKPTYIGCSVCEEWHLFSNFKAWMQTQDWEGKQLDKDLLVRGNKVYSPETCLFVTPEVNTFIVEKQVSGCPVGVTLRGSKYVAQITTGSLHKYLGSFDDPYLAHEAWRVAKNDYAITLASRQTCPLTAQALLTRYA